MTIPSRGYYLAACASLIALILLCLAWELKLAPIKTGGSWLVLKCLPLLAPLFGILHGRRYTYQWSSMLILLYLVEGVMRAANSSSTERLLAGVEIVLALSFFVSAIGYVRRQQPKAGLQTGNPEGRPTHHS